MPPSKAWKALERRVARFFKTERNPLSGGNGKFSRSDSRHPDLFIETKRMKSSPLITLFDKTLALSKLEPSQNLEGPKIPVVVISPHHRDPIVSVRLSDLMAFVEVIVRQEQSGVDLY